MTEAIGSYTPTYEPMTAASLAAWIACVESGRDRINHVLIASPRVRRAEQP